MTGRVLGDYEIVKQIGQGALGTVFLAEHRFMKRQYMIKVLPEELASDRSFIQRFEQKAGQIAALEHPNIVKIHNVSHAQGVYFLVSDCVVDELGETTNLSQHLVVSGPRLTEEEIFTILEQVAQSLDYAHQVKAGEVALVHGGLKLNNILVRKTSPKIDVALCDFGLSSVVGDGAMLSRTFRVVADTLDIVSGSSDAFANPPTESKKLQPLHQSFLQSFAFLAPEQKGRYMASTEPKALEPATDAYAFGVLAYYLITRRFPEGYFTMPSEMQLGHCWYWDGLIKSCLSLDAKARPESLVEALAKVKIGKVAAAPVQEVVQERIEAVQEAPAEKVEAPQLVAAAAPAAPQVAQVSPPQSMATEQTMIAPQSMATAQPMQTELKPIIKDPQLHRPQHDPDPAAALHVDSNVKQYQPERKEVENIEPIPTDMVSVKGDTFFRGSTDGNRDEMPQHQVHVNSFAIDTHPVTNEQYVRFLEVMGGEKDHNHQDLIKLKDSRISRSGGRLSIESGYAKHPVVGVTWYGAVNYARWVGKRLPTEAEWEIAACGGLGQVLYPYGEDIEKSQANFFSSDTTAVKSYAPNAYGMYDMAGNVYEWCHDWYGYNFYESSAQEPDNPRGPLQGVYRVLRGGCWKSLKEDLRCSRRHRNNPGTTNSTYGFRCVADVE